MEDNDAKKIRVLIVDDEERFRTTTRTALEKRGFLVRTVGRGVEAVEEIRTGGIDVVVLDIRMPGMDGHAVLREINNLGSDAKVIMLTAYGSMDSALEGLRDNVFAYMAKPCDIALLTNRIREAYAIKNSPHIGHQEQAK
jgi:DNA-binding NtrC family response regulator